jgi:hypothetical protein
MARDTAADAFRPATIPANNLAYSAAINGTAGENYYVEFYYEPAGSGVLHYVNFMEIDDFEDGHYYIATPQ